LSKRTSFTFKLDDAQQEILISLLKGGNYRPREVPYTRIAVEGEDCNIALYTSGKCVLQGKGAEDWVTFNLEPLVLGEVVTGYDDVLHPESSHPHMGVDESGKGDFFGPIVIAAAYVDEPLTRALRKLDVRDSKTITSDRKAEEMARAIRETLGNRYSLVVMGPQAYNRLYLKMGNVNRMLAWGHARAIENLLEKVPDCPEALSDQFGPKHQIERALLQKGRKIRLVQRPKAESDPAVAAASVLARAAFLYELKKIGRRFEVEIPKGASDRVREVAVEMVRAHGPNAMLETAKCHFRTLDKVFSVSGHQRSDLGPEGQTVSRASRGNFRQEKNPGTG
jgi:ribonuclease HIII